MDPFQIDQQTDAPLHTGSGALTVAAVRHYWQGLAAPGHVPARAAIDPEALAHHLRCLAIVERRPDSGVIFRLGGGTLRAALGSEPRGLPVRALFDIDTRSALPDLLHAVFRRPACLSLSLAATHATGPAQLASLAVLPLRDGNGQVSRGLLVLAPDRLRDLPGTRFRITRSHLDPVRRETMPGDRRPGRPDLRVIQGGRR